MSERTRVSSGQIDLFTPIEVPEFDVHEIVVTDLRGGGIPSEHGEMVMLSERRDALLEALYHRGEMNRAQSQLTARAAGKDVGEGSVSAKDVQEHRNLFRKAFAKAAGTQVLIDGGHISERVALDIQHDMRMEFETAFDTSRARDRYAAKLKAQK